MTSFGASTSYRSNADRVLGFLVVAVSGIAGTIVLVILAFLVLESYPVLSEVGGSRFFSDASWHPTRGRYNLLPMLWGSCAAMLGAVLLATPIGIASAVFSTFYAPRIVATSFRRLVELLAGVPSVVYGFWGLMVVVPWIGRLHPPGPSLLAGILILALMILPTIALISRAAIAQVPADLMRSAAALGLSKGAIVRSVVLPAARGGLVTSVILGTGRAIGETMAILMVSGNVVQTPESLFDPVRTLTSNIALEMAYAMGDHRSALFVSGLVLAAVVIALVVVAEILGQDVVYG